MIRKLLVVAFFGGVDCISQKNILLKHPLDKITVPGIHGALRKDFLVDGVTRNPGHWGGYWHSVIGDSRGFVKFDLVTRYYINEIRIKARTDCCSERLKNAQVSLKLKHSGSSEELTETLSVKKDPGLNNWATLNFSHTAFVPTSLEIYSASKETLDIVEVEAYGELSCQENVSLTEPCVCRRTSSFSKTCKALEICKLGECTDSCAEPLEHGCKNCTSAGSDYICDECNDGFRGTRCEVNLCETDGTKCKDGQCIGTRDNFTCNNQCKPGFTGAQCKTDLCSTTGNNCKKCIHLKTSVACSGCKAGFDGGLLCEIDLCLTKGKNCANGSCSGLDRDFTCSSCKDGFNGTRCETDLCATVGKNCNGLCVKLDKDILCPQCKSGFKGQRCEIDLCSTKGKNCEKGSCFGLQGDFNCTKCNPGFSGTQCERDICVTDGHNCKERKCFRTENSFFCDECKNGFVGNQCEMDLCENCEIGKCIRQKGGIKCGNCKPGFSGIQCEIDLCALDGKNCKLCKRLDGDIACDGCVNGFSGKRCEIDLCANCLGGCTREANDFQCVGGCKNGFRGAKCAQDICATDGKNCLKCLPTDRSFKCLRCKPGFSGYQCLSVFSEELQEAIDNPPFVAVGVCASIAFFALTCFIANWDGRHASLWHCFSHCESRRSNQTDASSHQSRVSRADSRKSHVSRADSRKSHVSRATYSKSRVSVATSRKSCVSRANSR